MNAKNVIKFIAWLFTFAGLIILSNINFWIAVGVWLVVLGIVLMGKANEQR